MKYTDATASENRTVLSVTELNQQLKQTISAGFALVWIEGEISNLARPASGHIYFSLKDQNAQIRCAMFRANNQRVAFKICNGTHVIARAKASLYEPRGDLQLIVEDLEEAGFGALQRQFELLKKQLHAEGLFDSDRKRSLPAFPQKMAIVTSASSAAIRDFLHIAQRRYPASKKTLYSVPVQGEEAPAVIQSAINAINSHADADVIVLIRGGGSIEDLWAFNDESVARSIANSSIPVITGVGHEIDYTIADFVADVRAPTPSAAAELTCPDKFTIEERLRSLQSLLGKLLKDKLNTNNQKLDWLSQRIQRTHPASIVSAQLQFLRQQYLRLERLVQSRLKESANRLDSFRLRLINQSPEQHLALQRSQLNLLLARLAALNSRTVDQHKHRLSVCTATLQAVSPLNTLQRGYSVTMSIRQKNKILASHSDAEPGDQLVTYLSKGKIFSRVESTSSQDLIKSDPKNKIHKA
jgi:exodeoxyribonuclease VII large subunit